MPIWSSRSPGYPQLLQFRCSHDPFLGLYNLLKQFTVPRKQFNYCQFITKDILKDIIEQTDEEIHMVSSGRVQTPGTSFSVEPGYATLPVCRCVHQPRSSWNLIWGNFYGGCITIGMINYYLNFQLLLFLKQKGGWGLSSKLLIVTWPFWDQPLYPGAHQ